MSPGVLIFIVREKLTKNMQLVAETHPPLHKSYQKKTKQIIHPKFGNQNKIDKKITYIQPSELEIEQTNTTLKQIMKSKFPEYVSREPLCKCTQVFMHHCRHCICIIRICTATITLWNLHCINCTVDTLYCNNCTSTAPTNQQATHFEAHSRPLSVPTPFHKIIKKPFKCKIGPDRQ